MFHYPTKKTDTGWKHVGPFLDYNEAISFWKKNRDDYAFVASVPTPIEADDETVIIPR
jgi:hypothetical protein